MNKSRLLAVAVTLSIAGIAGSAGAATVVFNDGSPYDEVVHANSAGSGTNLATKTKPGGYTTNLFSVDGLSVGNGDGVAIVSGLGSGQGDGFFNLLIDPLVDFSVIQFKIDGFGGQSPATLDFRVNFAGGGFQDILDVAVPNNNKFDIFAEGQEIFDSILIGDLRSGSGDLLRFKDVKQISFDVAAPGVPEPATWGMMILGIGMIGGVLRRRQRAELRYDFA